MTLKDPSHTLMEGRREPHSTRFPTHLMTLKDSTHTLMEDRREPHSNRFPTHLMTLQGSAPTLMEGRRELPLTEGRRDPAPFLTPFGDRV